MVTRVNRICQSFASASLLYTSIKRKENIYFGDRSEGEKKKKKKKQVIPSLLGFIDHTSVSVLSVRGRGAKDERNW